jgi:hypothetical protein
MRHYNLNYYFEVTETEINESDDLKEQLKTILEIKEYYKRYEEKFKIPPVSFYMRSTFYNRLNVKKDQIEFKIRYFNL